MKPTEAEQSVRKVLKELYEDGEASAIAAMVMDTVSGKSRSERLGLNDAELSSGQKNELYRILEELKTHKPIQYIFNQAHFYGLDLFVDPRVLIPRPETEELVHWIINDVKRSGQKVFERGATEADHTTQLKILDVGTGSGCIALALKNAMPLAEVWGCDVSEEALNVARRNGSDLNIRVDFQGLDFLDEQQQKQLPTVDIVVSNPPYIPLKDQETMSPNVTRFEPHKALFIPDEDPLLFYKALCQYSRHRLYENGVLYMETNESLAREVASLFMKEGFGSVEIRKDMQGKERMVKASERS